MSRLAGFVGHADPFEVKYSENSTNNTKNLCKYFTKSRLCMKARRNKKLQEAFTNLLITNMKYTSNQKSQLRSDCSNLEDQLQKGNVHL